MKAILCSALALAAWAADDPFDLVVAPPKPGNMRNSEADVLELRDGRLLLAWSEFSSAERASDWVTARIAARTSSDGGRTWGERFVLQENLGTMNTYSPDLLRLKSGKVLFFFFRKNSEADCQPMVRVSTDDARTFSPPREIPMEPSPSYSGINNDRAIQLKSGRVLLPVWFTKDYRVSRRIQIRMYYSDDEGGSWKSSPQVIDVPASSNGADEPTIEQRKDRRVLMWIRTKTGHPYQSLSADGGVTWSAPEEVALAAPNAPQSLRRIPKTGDLLLVWNNSASVRTPLTAAISKDEGKTWQHIKNLESDPNHTYAYTSIFPVRDRVLLTYYVGPSAQQQGEEGTVWSLKLRSFPVKWFYR
ncbi:MAG: sialidase family protein [Bryobacteraceae bacterium]